MDNKLNIEEKGGNEKIVNSLPFLVKAVAVFLIVYGTINFIYYVTVFVYSFINCDFLKDLEYYDFKNKLLLIPVIFKILINIGLIVSGVLILLKKKIGVTVFYFLFFISLFFSLFFLSYFNYVDMGAGVISIAILVYFRNNPNWQL